MFLSIQDNENDAVILLYNSDRMCYIVRKKYEGKMKMNRGQAKGAKLRERLIGDKAFYAEVVAVVIPIIIQNTVSNVVSLLDNVMVGASARCKCPQLPSSISCCSCSTFVSSEVWRGRASLRRNMRARRMTEACATASESSG